jgi:hypothetical protein
MEWRFVLHAIYTHLPSWESLAALAGAASAIAAFWTIRSTAHTKENERLLKHATQTLERAYEAIADGNHRIPPDPDRLAWLTAARLIVEYRETKKMISDRSIFRECESHEEYWRHQFYIWLSPLEIGAVGFYQTGPIDKTSAVVVHSFADWPDGRIDPLSIYETPQVAIDRLGVSRLWHSLRTYLGIP